MSYIQFNPDNGKIISVSFNKIDTVNYITVDEKVCHDFLSGCAKISQYRIKYSKILDDHILVPIEEYNSREPIRHYFKKYSNNFLKSIKDSRAEFDSTVNIIKAETEGKVAHSKHKILSFIIFLFHTIITFLYNAIIFPKNYIRKSFYRLKEYLFWNHIRVYHFLLNVFYKHYLKIKNIVLHFLNIFFDINYVISKTTYNYGQKGVHKSFLLFRYLYSQIIWLFNPYTSVPYLDNWFGIARQDVKELNNLCIIPWIHLHTWPNDDVYPCCMTPSDNPVGNLKTHSLKEIWNGNGMRNLRKTFLNNERPNSCDRCFAIEDNNGHSFRQHINERFNKDLELINDTRADGTVEMKLKYWDFRFSNICNFKCRTCGPHLSTGWYEDQEKLWGTLPDDLPDLDKKIDLWSQVEDILPEVEEIYFAGGEPLIMEEHYRILNKLIELGKKDVVLKYNTNFSTLKFKKQDVLKLWNEFKSVEIGASIDAYGDRAEYMRKGTDWARIIENRKQLKERAPHVHFYTNITIGVFNSYHIIDFCNWAYKTSFIEHPWLYHINLVQHPRHFSLQALPSNIKEDLTNKYKEQIKIYSEFRHSGAHKQWEMIMNYMNEQNIYEEEYNNLVGAIKSIDKIRNESFSHTFPELKELL